MAGHVLTGRLALQQPGGAGEEAHLVDHDHELLGAGQLERLAGVLRLGGDEIVGAGLDQVGEAEQRTLPFGGVAPPQPVRRRPRPVRRVDIVRAGQGRRTEDLAGGRIDELAGSAAERVPRGSVDEISHCSHRGLPGWRLDAVAVNI